VSDENLRDWRAEVDCERCADWEGPPPVPLSEARRAYPPKLGFKVSHADYRARSEDGEWKVIPTTVVEHPGMFVQWFPKLPR
jgi:hypothetical protein